MNTPLTLHGPLHPTWSQVLRWWRSWRSRAPAPGLEPESADALDALVELDARTLDDIGAPERLVARAQARREARQHELDDLRAGVSASGWRYW